MARRLLPKYTYLPVECTQCGWRGKRGNRVGWFACPRCLAPGHQVEFIKNDSELHPCSGGSEEEDARRLNRVTEELKRVVQTWRSV